MPASNAPRELLEWRDSTKTAWAQARRFGQRKKTYELGDIDEISSWELMVSVKRELCYEFTWNLLDLITSHMSNGPVKNSFTTFADDFSLFDLSQSAKHVAQLLHTAVTCRDDYNSLLRCTIRYATKIHPLMKLQLPETIDEPELLPDRESSSPVSTNVVVGESTPASQSLGSTTAPSTTPSTPPKAQSSYPRAHQRPATVAVFCTPIKPRSYQLIPSAIPKSYAGAKSDDPSMLLNRHINPERATRKVTTRTTMTVTATATAETLQDLLKNEFSGSIEFDVPRFTKTYIIEEEGAPGPNPTPLKTYDERSMKAALEKKAVLDPLKGGWIFPGTDDTSFPKAFCETANMAAEIDFRLSYTSPPLSQTLANLTLSTSAPVSLPMLQPPSKPRPLWITTKDLPTKTPTSPLSPATSIATSSSTHVSSRLRPDFLLLLPIAQGSEVEKGGIPWSRTLLVGEHSSQGSTPSKSLSQLLTYVNNVFHAQPTRAWVWACRTSLVKKKKRTKTGTEGRDMDNKHSKDKKEGPNWKIQTDRLLIQFFLIDRSGAVSSRTYLFSHAADAMRVMRAVVGLTNRLRWHGWGFLEVVFGPERALGPSMLSIPGPSVGNIMKMTVPSSERTWKEVTVMECIFRSGGALGRGTTCFIVMGDLEGTGERRYVVKMTWRDTARMSTEQEFFKAVASGGGAPGLAGFVAGGELNHGMIKLHANKRGVHTGGVDDIQDNWNGGVSSSSSEDTDATPTQSKPSLAESRPVRKLTFLILSTLGQPIRLAVSLSSLLNSMLAALHAHASLYFSHDILHRDISYQNILITAPYAPCYPPSSTSIHGLHPPEYFSGCLIDLDYASHCPSHNRAETPNRTGTLPFIAPELLQLPGTRHTYLHDLQSFVFVYLWVCIDLTGVEGTRQEITPAQQISLKHINDWNRIEFGELTCGDKKEYGVLREERWREIIGGFRDGFGNGERGEVGRKVAAGLRDILWPVFGRSGGIRAVLKVEGKEAEMEVWQRVRGVLERAVAELEKLNGNNL